MKQFRRFALMTILAIASGQAWAVTVVQCEDENGNRAFHDQCPPGMKQVGQKQYSTSTPTGGAQALPEMVLYMVPNCDSCEQVKEFLAVRNISVTEKNVAEDAALQLELKDKAGDLRVPVLLIGEHTLAGYNREALLNALKDAGYKENTPAAAAEEPETEEAAAEEAPEGE